MMWPPAFTVTCEVQGGYGHFGQQNDVTLHVGLGGCDGVDEIQVRWPDAARTVQTWTSVKTNQFLLLRQGEPGAFVLSL